MKIFSILYLLIIFLFISCDAHYVENVTLKLNKTVIINETDDCILSTISAADFDTINHRVVVTDNRDKKIVIIDYETGNILKSILPTQDLTD